VFFVTDDSLIVGLVVCVVVLFVVVAIMVVVVVVVMRVLRRRNTSSRFYTTLLLTIVRVCLIKFRPVDSVIVIWMYSLLFDGLAESDGPKTTTGREIARQKYILLTAT